MNNSLKTHFPAFLIPKISILLFLLFNTKWKFTAFYKGKIQMFTKNVFDFPTS